MAVPGSAEIAMTKSSNIRNDLADAWLVAS
jgi:hypothetical protein